MTMSLKYFVANLEKQLCLSDEELEMFKVASNHNYNCQCHYCQKYQELVGEELYDE